MLLKKSYDYFKTLKDMSDCIGNAYRFLCHPDKYRKEILLFNASRKELSENLCEEFVAPIERNDIYNLSSCLVGEIYPLDYICFLAYKTDDSFLQDDLNDFLIIQSRLIVGLSYKNYGSLLGEVSSAQTNINNRRIKMISASKDFLNKGENVLLKYTLFEKVLKFTEGISYTFNELERVIINNI